MTNTFHNTSLAQLVSKLPKSPARIAGEGLLTSRSGFPRTRSGLTFIVVAACILACTGPASAQLPGAPAADSASREAPATAAAVDPQPVRVNFSSPVGMHVGWQTGTEGNKQLFAKDQLTVPARNSFQPGKAYRLMFTDIPAKAGLTLYPLLYLYNPQPGSPAGDYLEHSALSLTVTNEDVEQVESNNLVTKVLYLLNPSSGEGPAGYVEEIVSTRLGPGADPIEEAKKRGTPLALLQLGNRTVQQVELIEGPAFPQPARKVELPLSGPEGAPYPVAPVQANVVEMPEGAFGSAFDPRATGPLPAAAIPSQNYVASQNTIIAISEDKKSLWGYSKELGKWSKVTLDEPLDGAIPSLSQDVGCYCNKEPLPADQIVPGVPTDYQWRPRGNVIWAYSGPAGRWDKLQLPEGHRAVPQISWDMIIVNDEGTLHIFSANTGRWASQDEMLAQAIGGAATRNGEEAGQPEVVAFKLKHIAPAYAESIIREVMADMVHAMKVNTRVDERTGSLLVMADAATLKTIRELLTKLDTSSAVDAAQGKGGMPSLDFKVFPLQHVDPALAEKMLTELIPDRSLTMTADSRTNSLLVRGSAADLEVIQAILEQLDVAGPKHAPEESEGMTSNAAANRGLQFLFDTIKRSQGEQAASIDQQKQAYAQHDAAAKKLASQLDGRVTGSDPNVAPKKIEARREQLRQEVEAAFEARQQQQRGEVALLAQRLRSIQATIEARERIKDRIIERRIEELLNPALQWPSPTQGKSQEVAKANPSQPMTGIPVGLTGPLHVTSTPTRNQPTGVGPDNPGAEPSAPPAPSLAELARWHAATVLVETKETGPYANESLHPVAAGVVVAADGTILTQVPKNLVPSSIILRFDDGSVVQGKVVTALENGLTVLKPDRAVTVDSWFSLDLATPSTGRTIHLISAVLTDTVRYHEDRRTIIRADRRIVGFDMPLLQLDRDTDPSKLEGQYGAVGVPSDRVHLPGRPLVSPSGELVGITVQGEGQPSDHLCFAIAAPQLAEVFGEYVQAPQEGAGAMPPTPAGPAASELAPPAANRSRPRQVDWETLERLQSDLKAKLRSAGLDIVWVNILHRTESGGFERPIIQITFLNADERTEIERLVETIPLPPGVTAELDWQPNRVSLDRVLRLEILWKQPRPGQQVRVEYTQATPIRDGDMALSVTHLPGFTSLEELQNAIERVTYPAPRASRGRGSYGETSDAGPSDSDGELRIVAYNSDLHLALFKAPGDTRFGSFKLGESAPVPGQHLKAWCLDLNDSSKGPSSSDVQVLERPGPLDVRKDLLICKEISHGPTPLTYQMNGVPLLNSQNELQGIYAGEITIAEGKVGELNAPDGWQGLCVVDPVGMDAKGRPNTVKLLTAVCIPAGDVRKLIDTYLAQAIPNGTAANGTRRDEEGSAEVRAINALKGKWVLEERTSGGKQPDGFVATNYYLLFGERDRHLFVETQDSQDSPLSFSVNPSKSPAEMTIFGNNMLIEGVYKVEGDLLTLAYYGRSEKERPHAFTPDPTRQTGSPLVVDVYRRSVSAPSSDQRLVPGNELEDGVSGGQLILRSAGEFGGIAELQENIRFLQQQYRKGFKPLSEVTAAQNRLQTLQLEYAAQMKLLQIAVDEAKTKLDAAKTDYERVAPLRKTNAVSNEVYDVSRLALRRAELELARMTTLYELYEKIGKGQAADEMTSPKNGSDGGAASSPAAVAGPLLSELLGMEFKQILHTDERLKETSFRGGMLVTNVQPVGPAKIAGVRTGDVLVGLDRWETVSQEDVEHVLQPGILRRSTPLKFFVVRNGETLFGHLPLSPGVIGAEVEPRREARRQQAVPADELRDQGAKPVPLDKEANAPMGTTP